MKRLSIPIFTCALAVCAGAQAQAQTPVTVTQHSEAVTAPAVELPRQLVINVGLGGTINSGNTKAVAANAGSQLSFKKSIHQLGIELLGTIGYADDPATGGTDYERNAGGVIGRARYDLFLSRMDAVFVAVQPRRDVNAGLDVRLQNQVGYLRNLFYPSDDHRLWLEAGYDLTFDNFAEITTTTITDVTADVPAAVTMDPDGTVGTVARTTLRIGEPDSEVIHSGRLFFGYVNRLSAIATASLGVETLIEPKELDNVRVNGLADLTSSLSSRFKLGIQFRALFDNVPVPGKEKLDTITALQLIYNYDSLAAAVAAAAPCDCSADVAAAQAACEEKLQAACGGAAPAPEPSAVDAPDKATLEPAVEPSAAASDAPSESGASDAAEAAPKPQ